MKKVGLRYRILEQKTMISTTAVEVWDKDEMLFWYECWCDCETESIDRYDENNHLETHLVQCLSSFNRKNDSAMELIMNDIYSLGYEIDRNQLDEITDHKLWYPKN